VRTSNPTTDDYARFEVLTAVVMKSTIFWDILPCSLPQKIILFITTAENLKSYSIPLWGDYLKKWTAWYYVLQDSTLSTDD
jgi:hypothetical protein